MEISKLVSDFSYQEIKERRWRRCRFFHKEKEILLSEYAVSDRGEVMRISPPKAKGRTYLGKICNFNDQWDYISGSFRKDGKSYRIYIHSLVMQSFIGPYPKGKEINHIDGIKHNNNLENLEYVTRSENSEHAFRIGLRPNFGLALVHGKDHPNAKLSQEEVNEIRKLWESERFSQKELGIKYNVSESCVFGVVNWHTYNPKKIKYISKFKWGGKRRGIRKLS